MRGRADPGKLLLHGYVLTDFLGFRTFGVSVSAVAYCFRAVGSADDVFVIY